MTRREGIQRLAVFPTVMDDGTWIWLKRYWVFYHVTPALGLLVETKALTKEAARHMHVPAYIRGLAARRREADEIHDMLEEILAKVQEREESGGANG